MIVRNSLSRFLLISAVLLSPLAASAQTLSSLSPRKPILAVPDGGSAYVVTDVNGQSSCRDATPAEAAVMNARPNVPLRVFGEERAGVRTHAGGGLNIILRGTTQLDANPQAKAAFESAAEIWESRISNAVTVIVDVDFGPLRFGVPFPDPNIIASANSDSYRFSDGDYAELRGLLLARADNAAELALYNSLPATAVPTDVAGGTLNNFAAPSMLLRTLGVVPQFPPEATPDDDSFPNIGFNSAFQYDFDPSNGIAVLTKDFEGVVVHELGHMLGFTSRVGAGEVGAIEAPTILDFFRFRPGVTTATFTTALRILTTGGDQIFFAGGEGLALSTGNPSGENGDGNQASHWKDDAITGTRIGIMDPTLANARRSELTQNDLDAFAIIGWSVGAPSGCSESEPNETSANADDLTPGAPCSGNAASSDASSYQITYNNGTVTDGIEDVFKVTLASPARISATMTFTTSAADLDIMLFTVSGSTLTIVPGGLSNGASTTEQFTTTNVLAAGTYYLGLSAFTGSSNYTVTASTVDGVTVPVAPVLVSATATSASQVNLVWTDNANNETEYLIERKSGAAAFAQVGTAAANATTFSSTGLAAGTTYTFRVRARNSGVDSAYSNELSATTNVTPGPCVANATTVCLLSDRFRVVIDFVNPFSNPPNQPGTFLSARLLQGVQNPDTALFGFSSAQAVEVVVRVQDTRPFAPRFDVYFGGMTDVGYTVTVSDMQTGVTRQYRNTAGTVGGGVDRASFPAN